MADLVPSATHFYVQGHENVSKTQQEVIGIRQLASVVGLLESFVSADTQHDLLRLDNATAVAYVNHVGGTRSPDLAALALEMWSWALERGLTLSATHVPGLTNTLADKCSRVFSGQVWESQAWYPKVLNMLFESPVLLPQSWDLLFLPHNRRPHPLLPDLMLAAWPRSGDSCRVGAFRQGLQTSSSRLGEKALLDSISQHGLSGPADQGNLPESVLGGLPAGQALVCLHIPERISKADFFPSERRGGEQKLFISFSRPHRPVGSATLARWVKSVLGTAGVDTATFSAHSTRGASTSAATAAGVSLHSIMNAADWSRESTFLKYYRRDNNQHTFCQAVLSTALKSA
ncbi:myoblast fusion [Branchiostoma belcheri]|nr:myoblast fusion [Branchiostoma belcheri]